MKIQNLELVARSVVEGFVNGLHRSPYLGFSVDFAEYREYRPGDEIRRIDWNVFSRSDKLYVKLYEGETNTKVLVLLDISGSMNYGSGEVKKIDYARVLAACLSYRQPYIAALTAGKAGFEAQKDLKSEIDQIWEDVKKLANSQLSTRSAKERANG